MRTDHKASVALANVFIDEKENRIWSATRALATIQHSFSGNERNRLFLNRGGRQFVDVSGISGLDSPADGRVLVVWDYDRDGRQDFAVVNSNAPLLNIYHNDIAPRRGPSSEDSDSRTRTTAATGAPPSGGVIAIRFVGGNPTDQPSREFSARDGFGASVSLSAGTQRLQREHRCGDGFAAQNSATLLIGIGQRAEADHVEIRWPSGQVQKVGRVPAGTLLTVFENPQQSPDGRRFRMQQYRVRPTAPASPPAHPPKRVLTEFASHADPNPAETSPKLRLYTTMATWCVACRRHQPQLEQLQTAFGKQTLEILGVPIDENDSPDDLSDYSQRYRLGYRLLAEVTDAQRSQVEQILALALTEETLPATIVTDSTGNILLTVAGVPTVSALRKLLRHRPNAQRKN